MFFIDFVCNLQVCLFSCLRGGFAVVHRIMALPLQLRVGRNIAAMVAASAAAAAAASVLC